MATARFLPVKFLMISLGAMGLVLAGNLGHAAASAKAPATPQARTEFGGVSAQTATAAGVVDAGAAWFTLGPDGLRMELTTR